MPFNAQHISMQGMSLRSRGLFGLYASLKSRFEMTNFVFTFLGEFS
jgi:hypothetical protein